jgi:hypothetical protein
MFDTIFIYVPSTKQIIRISEGSGDNLLDEDIENGYVDYIYYEQHAVSIDFPEVDGGQIMLAQLFQEQFTCTKDAIPNVLDMAYGDETIPYVVLD